MKQTEFLIITSNSFADEVQPLAKWKTQRGLFETIETVEFNLMGDPEVPLWLDIPLPLNISTTSNNATRTISVHVESDDSPISDVVVTMVGDSVYQRAVTDVNGEVQLSMPNVQSLSDVTITVSKNGFTPSELETTVPQGGFGINILSIETAGITAVTIAVVAITVVIVKRRT